MAAAGAVLSLLCASAMVAAVPGAARAQDGELRLLHLPMRWCVLEGTIAARRDPNKAVLERIRRGSSVLAPGTGITLRGALDAVLATSAGFPVIRDPRPGLGRRGDVRVPTESLGEYGIVVSACGDAWSRLQQAAGQGSRLGGVARGPVAVIIRSFVSGSGQPVTNIWGYAISASTNGDYCDARGPRVRSASGGSLLVIDSSGGTPSVLSDRRLIAHEVGHILRLGHGDGMDNPGSAPGRIDKFCDSAENPDIAPGSLMSASLRYGRVTPWQRRLPRTVAARHPGTVEDRPVLVPRSRVVRWTALQRAANGGHRLVARSRRGRLEPMSPLPWLRPAGVRGYEASDDVRDAVGPGGAGAVADIEGISVAVDEESGEVDVSVRFRGLPGDLTTVEHDVFGDGDGDAGTGGPPDAIEGGPDPEVDDPVGIDFVIRGVIEGGSVAAEAWRWDQQVGSWITVDPPPIAQLDGSFGEDDEAINADTMMVRLAPGSVELSERPNLRAVSRATDAQGRTSVDVLPGEPGEPGDGAMVAMSLEPAIYPVCAVNRTALHAGTVEPGGQATIEVYGFGEDGPVSVWLGDRPEPIATGGYEEMVDDPWPWVTQLTMPTDLDDTLQMVQVSLGDGGLTADCPVLVGDADPAALAGG
jgi:hypothetical protein